MKKIIMFLILLNILNIYSKDFERELIKENIVSINCYPAGNRCATNDECCSGECFGTIDKFCR